MAAKATAGELTEKQEAFAVAFFETGNAAEAYRRSYNVADDAKDGWIYVEACQLLDNPKITKRLDALRDQAARLAIYNRQTALDEYERAREVAETEKNPSAMVSAINGKVKLCGLEAPTKSSVIHDVSDPLAELLGSVAVGSKRIGIGRESS